MLDIIQRTKQARAKSKLGGRNYERFNRAFKGFRAFRVMPCNWLWRFVFIFLLISEVQIL